MRIRKVNHEARPHRPRLFVDRSGTGAVASWSIAWALHGRGVSKGTYKVTFNK